MQLSDLDGFLTGVICSPEVIMPSTWLPVAFGSSEIGAPPEIIEMVMSRYNEIVDALNSDPPILEPNFLAGQGRPCHCDGLVRRVHGCLCNLFG